MILSIYLLKCLLKLNLCIGRTNTHTFIYANRLAKPKCPKIRGNVYAQKNTMSLCYHPSCLVFLCQRIVKCVDVLLLKFSGRSKIFQVQKGLFLQNLFRNSNENGKKVGREGAVFPKSANPFLMCHTSIKSTQ